MSKSLDKRLEALEERNPSERVWMKAVCDDGSIELLAYDEDLYDYVLEHGYYSPTGKHFHDVRFKEWEGESDPLSAAMHEWQVEIATAEGTDRDPRKMLDDMD